MAEVLNLPWTSDLSAATAVTDDSGDLSWQSASGLGGTAGGVQLVLDDTTSILIRVNFTQFTTQTDVRLRGYTDFGTLSMSAGNLFDHARIEAGSAVSQGMVRIGLDSGVIKLQHVAMTDAGTEAGTEFVTVPTDEEFYWELWVKKASTNVAADAISRLYINGTLASTIQNYDLFDNFDDIVRIRIGAVSGVDDGTSGTFHMDEHILRDDNTVIGGNNVDPVLTVPGAQRYVIGVAEVISGISFTDPDDNESVMTFTCNQGTFAAPTPTGVDVSGSGTSTMTLTGTRTELNAYCAAGNGPTYTHTAANHTADTITVNIDDQVGTPDEDTIAVTALDWRITADNMADLNATFQNVLVTETTAQTVTMTVRATDSGSRTDEAVTSLVVTDATVSASAPHTTAIDLGIHV